MTDEELDSLLERAVARRPTPGLPPLDMAAGLLRLSRDLVRLNRGELQPPPWWAWVSPTADGTAADRLVRLCQWIVDQPQAVRAIRQLADAQALNGDSAAYDPEEHIAGARVFGCFLYLEGHPVSAAFWWGFAAGGEDQISAYSLFLLNMDRGDGSRASAWLDQTLSPAPTLPGGDLHQALEQHYNGAPLTQRTERVQEQLDRLIRVSTREGLDQEIVAQPDAILADTLAALA